MRRRRRRGQAWLAVLVTAGALGAAVWWLGQRFAASSAVSVQRAPTASGEVEIAPAERAALEDLLRRKAGGERPR